MVDRKKAPHPNNHKLVQFIESNGHGPKDAKVEWQPLTLWTLPPKNAKEGKQLHHLGALIEKNTKVAKQPHCSENA